MEIVFEVSFGSVGVSVEKEDERMRGEEDGGDDADFEVEKGGGGGTTEG